MDEDSYFEPHWGYFDRVLPCKSDAGSCEYDDLIYGSHDRGILYSGILYGSLGALLLIWCIAIHWSSKTTRVSRTMSTFIRRYTSRETRRLRVIFGRVTRLQLILLGSLTTYLVVTSFVGMRYHKWITPVEGGYHKTRTTLGSFSDRVGILAYALTPISILLSSRESLLSAVTGVPYQHFNFLHRWVGHIIMFQSAVHTIGWCIIEIRLYEPQPEEARLWMQDLYMAWGVVALIFLLLLWILATPWAQRAFGYEFFRKAHWVLAMLYIGACWGHWEQLKCFMLPSLVLWFIDRGIRLLRTALIHYQVLGSGYGEFATFTAKITHFESDVVRLDVDYPFTWKIGQHFYLTFTAGSIWQSHPFTPLSLPGSKQAYILRAKRGETKRVTQFSGDSTPVILTGAYGGDIVRDLTPSTNVLCIAGGTGISFVLPVLLFLAKQELSTRTHIVWVVRHAVDVEWIRGELDQVLENTQISVVVHATRDKTPLAEGHHELAAERGSDKPSTETERHVALRPGRPDIDTTITEFLKLAAGPSRVYVSGPSDMVTSVRDKVAVSNDARRVWHGEDEFDVEVVYDDRLE